MEVDEEEVALRAQQEKEAKALHKLQKLAHSLKMDPEALHEMDLDAKDARHLLHLGQKTQSICWRRRGLMVSDVELLRKALAWNRLIRRETIRRIDLATNMVGAAGAQSLAECLRGSATLTTLHLGENSLHDEGAAAVASLLEGDACASLTDLDLKHNFLSAKGVAALAAALRTNASLTSLGLAFNQLCHSGVRPLAEVAFGNLHQVDLRDNLMDDRACRVLAAGVVANMKQLKRLDVRENSIMSREATAILGKAAKDRRRKHREDERKAKRKAKKEKKKFHPTEAPPPIEFYWLEPHELRPMPGSSKAATFVASHVCCVS